MRGLLLCVVASACAPSTPPECVAAVAPVEYRGGACTGLQERHGLLCATYVTRTPTATCSRYLCRHLEGGEWTERQPSACIQGAT